MTACKILQASFSRPKPGIHWRIIGDVFSGLASIWPPVSFRGAESCRFPFQPGIKPSSETAASERTASTAPAGTSFYRP